MSIKRLQTKLQKQLDERNEKIKEDALTFKYCYNDLAKKYNLSRARIAQILSKARIQLPMTRGTVKYNKWKKRISASSKKKKKKK